MLCTRQNFLKIRKSYVGATLAVAQIWAAARAAPTWHLRICEILQENDELTGYLRKMDLPDFYFLSFKLDFATSM